jgi:hypothetical protein
MAEQQQKKTLTGLQRQFLSARDVSVPLVAVRTADPAATIAGLAGVVIDQQEKPGVVVQWDCGRGMRPVPTSPVPPNTSLDSTPAGQWIKQVRGETCINPFDALDKAQGLPPHGCFVMMNGNEFYNDVRFRQALWNLRDPFKRNWRTCVVTQPYGNVPMSLEHDVLMIDEPLPGPDELRAIVLETCRTSGLPVPADDVQQRAVDATAGLSAFAAEQAMALSLRKSGIDLAALRERHRQMIENTKGLTVWKGGETFANVGGLRNYVSFARRFLAGRYRPGAVLWIDEIEKALAGVKGDLTGIAQDYLGTLLGYLQDQGIPGFLLMGHPGTGKSALAKATGNEAGVPTIRMDMGAMHGSLVGESQHAIRHALKVTTAVSQGRPIAIATCNSVAVLPPELLNRFKWRFFVDLPDAEERKVIWQIHMAKRQLDPKQKRPQDLDWNGREIEQCVETAYQLNCSVMEAAQFVVPIAQSSAEEMEDRRRHASGRYLSASHEGSYGHEPKKEVELAGGRKIKLPEGDAPTWVAPPSGKAN